LNNSLCEIIIKEWEKDEKKLVVVLFNALALTIIIESVELCIEAVLKVAVEYYKECCCCECNERLDVCFHLPFQMHKKRWGNRVFKNYILLHNPESVRNHIDQKNIYFESEIERKVFEWCWVKSLEISRWKRRRECSSRDKKSAKKQKIYIIIIKTTTIRNRRDSSIFTNCTFISI
jgi:hypothetical protein